MQNVGQSENRNIDKVNVQLDVVKSSTPQSSASSPAKSETETYSGAPAKYMTDSSESEDDSVSEVKRVLFLAEAVAVRECAICTAPNTARDILYDQTVPSFLTMPSISIICSGIEYSGLQRDILFSILDRVLVACQIFRKTSDSPKYVRTTE